MKSKLTISRKWNNPQIFITVGVEGMSLQMDMEDFKEALKREIGSVAWTFTQSGFYRTLDEAITRVISGIKEESKKVI